LTRVRPSGDSSPLRGSVGVSVKCPSLPGRISGPACPPCYPQRSPPRAPSVCASSWASRPGRPSAGRPAQRPTAEDVRVHMVDGLPGVVPGIEHHPVTRLRHAGFACHQRRLSRDLVKEAVTSLRDRGKVLMVLFRYHQNVHRRLRVYVPECDSARAFKHPRRRDIPRRDAAEQAISHAKDLNR
jgi:hypothetical protein